MDNQALIDLLSTWFDSLEFEHEGQYLNVSVSPENLHNLAHKLKTEETCKFDYMFCLTGVDWPDCFELVYHLESSIHHHVLVLRCKTENRENPKLDTLCDLWPTAEFHEREVYDLLGVHFNNHPDLRRILLDDDWKGHPLRKDYEDDVNLVVK